MQPGKTTGDIILNLKQKPHDVFTRDKDDLTASLKISLMESLCGFERIVLKHLDGRGIRISRKRGDFLKPGQILRINGEGMPKKRGEQRGNLYLLVEVEYPDSKWMSSVENVKKLEAILKDTVRIDAPLAETVDEVEYTVHDPEEEVSSSIVRHNIGKVLTLVSLRSRMKRARMRIGAPTTMMKMLMDSRSARSNRLRSATTLFCESLSFYISHYLSLHQVGPNLYCIDIMELGHIVLILYISTYFDYRTHHTSSDYRSRRFCAPQPPNALNRQRH